MPHPDEPALVRYVSEHASATALGVYGSSDPDRAAAALRAASLEIGQIRHPDEPDDPLPNWCAVLDADGVPVLHLDMKDEIRYAALVVRIVLDQLAKAGVDGRLEPKREPEPAFPYDASADIYTGLVALSELDGRGLPPGFPDGFPVPPDATLVLAQRVRDGDAQHAAWRSAGPFTGYLQRLRGFGCAFGAVPRLLTQGHVRYTLWREGAGGSVTLFQTSGSWYASVVWQPRAEPPTTEVEPDEAPDTRPVPAGRAAARELAEFLVPAPLVDGYETVITLATVGDQLNRLARAQPRPRNRDSMPAVMAARFAPLLGRLTADQLTLLRHVCLTMVMNVITSGRHARPDGLRIVPDDEGYLYAADLREHAEDAVFETGAVLAQGGRMVGDAMSLVRTAPVPPPAHAYAWLFEGLDAGQLTAASEAGWQIFEP